MCHTRIDLTHYFHRSSTKPFMWTLRQHFHTSACSCGFGLVTCCEAPPMQLCRREIVCLFGTRTGFLCPLKPPVSVCVCVLEVTVESNAAPGWEMQCFVCVVMVMVWGVSYAVYLLFVCLRTSQRTGVVWSIELYQFNAHVCRCGKPNTGS